MTFLISACGSSFHLARLTSAFILSHQDERHKYQKGVVCRWSIITSSPLWLRVEFAKFDVEFSENCSKDYVELSNSNFGKVCGNNLTGVSQVLRQTQINVTFTTDNSNEFGGFILKITSVGMIYVFSGSIVIKYCCIDVMKQQIMHALYRMSYFYIYYETTTVQSNCGV